MVGVWLRASPSGAARALIEPSWRALGEDESSLRISDGGSMDRSSKDYRYEPALLQFEKHLAAMEMPAEAIARL